MAQQHTMQQHNQPRQRPPFSLLHLPQPTSAALLALLPADARGSLRLACKALLHLVDSHTTKLRFRWPYVQPKPGLQWRFSCVQELHIDSDMVPIVDPMVLQGVDALMRDSGWPHVTTLSFTDVCVSALEGSLASCPNVSRLAWLVRKLPGSCLSMLGDPQLQRIAAYPNLRSLDISLVQCHCIGWWALQQCTQLTELRLSIAIQQELPDETVNLARLTALQRLHLLGKPGMDNASEGMRERLGATFAAHMGAPWDLQLPASCQHLRLCHLPAMLAAPGLRSLHVCTGVIDSAQLALLAVTCTMLAELHVHAMQLLAPYHAEPLCSVTQLVVGGPYLSAASVQLANIVPALHSLDLGDRSVQLPSAALAALHNLRELPLHFTPSHVNCMSQLAHITKLRLLWQVDGNASNHLALLHAIDNAAIMTQLMHIAIEVTCQDTSAADRSAVLLALNALTAWLAQLPALKHVAYTTFSGICPVAARISNVHLLVLLSNPSIHAICIHHACNAATSALLAHMNNNHAARGLQINIT